eukprot:SM000147S01129  [mRNA]  locus=s147:236523:238980:- [translate_table: standard]
MAVEEHHKKGHPPIPRPPSTSLPLAQHATWGLGLHYRPLTRLAVAHVGAMTAAAGAPASGSCDSLLRQPAGLPARRAPPLREERSILESALVHHSGYLGRRLQGAAASTGSRRPAASIARRLAALPQQAESHMRLACSAGFSRVFLPTVMDSAGRPSSLPAGNGPELALRAAQDPPKALSGGVLTAAEAEVPAAVEALRRGAVIALPTDTLYGLAADACSEAAIRKLYEIKGRMLSNPLAICTADISDLDKYAAVEHLPPGLLHSLLPGPVTLVLPRDSRSQLHPSLNPGNATVGVRIPDSPFIRQVCRAFRGALALTSANPSSQPSTTAVHEFETLWHSCAFVFDGGQLQGGSAGSTIIDLSSRGSFRILRRGSALESTQAILYKHNLIEHPPST